MHSKASHLLQILVLLKHCGNARYCSSYAYILCRHQEKNHFLLGTTHVASLFNAIPEASFFVKDRQSRFICVNECFLRIHGCSKELENGGEVGL